MTTTKTTLEKFMTSYVHSLPSEWPNIEFEQSGLARLLHCAGFFRGLVACGKKELAEAMAQDLTSQLDILDGYGGQFEVVKGKADDDSDVIITFPRYRIVLSDDGTFGGFSILWYAAINNETRLEAAKSIQEYSGLKEGRSADEMKNYDRPDDPWKMTWPDAIVEAEKSLRIKKSLEQWRTYWYSTEPDRMCHRELMHYGFNFNGGLLYSGPGCDETFSVNLTPVRFWSIHT